MPSIFELISSICFFLAILHTFSVKYFQKTALRYPEGSTQENFFHLLGEVEVVFGIWGALFLMMTLFFSYSLQHHHQYLESRNYTEPIFVFVIMTMCSTRPILFFAEKLIFFISRLIPLQKNISIFFSSLVVGPLLGSFITEPAAMTVTAYFLLEHFYQKGLSDKLKFATIGLLFVNISIGGTLTPYAAPPVLMVAKTWNWDLTFMLIQFGWKAIISLVLSTLIIILIHKKELARTSASTSLPTTTQRKIPFWVVLLHLIFLVFVVLTAHYPILFMGFFLFFLGVVAVTNEYQTELKLKEALLVAFFLAGLIVLGGTQKWWLQPLLSQLGSTSLYIGSILLTSITDNAALTYLGSLVENLSDLSKYSLVAGSVVGGGLTVIANAPNPAGYSILNKSFGESGINPFRLFLSALSPTLIAAFCFFFL